MNSENKDPILRLYHTISSVSIALRCFVDNSSVFKRFLAQNVKKLLTFYRMYAYGERHALTDCKIVDQQ